MSDYVLTAKPPLGGAVLTFEGAAITEVTGRAIVSVSIPNGGGKALSKALASSYKLAVPSLGETTVSKTGNTRAVGLQHDQIFLLFDCLEPNALEQVAGKLGNSAYLTDQSDSWAMFALSGSNIPAVLERLSPIDLNDNVFPVGRTARTVMDHLSAIIIREKPDIYVLLSPRSSAAFFRQMLETTINNVI